jgi:hypothetical protein
MTTHIQELKKKRETKSLPAASRVKYSSRPHAALKKEREEFKFSMLGNLRESFGDIQSF